MTLNRIAKCANRINKKYHNYRLLDVGCRTMDLKPMLKGCREYIGTDLIPKAGVIKCDLEQPLQFDDNEFDLVTVLDVLEHLNNPHGTLHELYRIARKAVFISLPNMYYLTFRFNFLIGKGISGKYRFPPYPVIDRHRWILSYTEALEFIIQNSEHYHVEHEMILPVRGRTKSVSEPVQKILAGLYPNLFAYGILFEITVNN